MRFERARPRRRTGRGARMRFSSWSFLPWWSPSLFPLEHRLSFLHEGAPALDVVLAVEALLDQRRAGLPVERRTRLQQLADDALARPDGERRVLRDRRAILAQERFHLGDRSHPVNEDQ